METEYKRDLTLIERGEQYLIIACDSCGGVGNKDFDEVKVAPEIVGYYTTRVALMELLSVGAAPLAVINTLSVEMEPTGRRIISGIENLLREVKIDLEIINGSTEENFPMKQTAMGVTLIGEVEKNQLRLSKSQRGDFVLLLGIPKVGGEITLPYDEEICSFESLNFLKQHPSIGDIIPVGSKGIAYEAQLLAALNKCKIEISLNKIDMKKSAGPATVLIFTVPEADMEELQESLREPLHIIGRLV